MCSPATTGSKGWDATLEGELSGRTRPGTRDWIAWSNWNSHLIFWSTVVQFKELFLRSSCLPALLPYGRQYRAFCLQSGDTP